MRDLDNDGESLNWLLIRSTLRVRKKLFSAPLAISCECIRCDDIDESIALSFFYWPIIWLLWKLLEGYRVRVLIRKFFILETSSVCSNIVPSLNKRDHHVFLCLLDIWTTRQKGFHKGNSFSSLMLVVFLSTKLEIKFCLRDKDSLLRNSAKNGWMLCVCVARKVLFSSSY